MSQNPPGAAPKKDKSYKSRTRKTRNLVTPAKSCPSCQKTRGEANFVLMSKKPGAAPKKDKSHKSRTRKTRNLVTPAKSCPSCQKT